MFVYDLNPSSPRRITRDRRERRLLWRCRGYRLLTSLSGQTLRLRRSNLVNHFASPYLNSFLVVSEAAHLVPVAGCCARCGAVIPERLIVRDNRWLIPRHGKIAQSDRLLLGCRGFVELTRLEKGGSRPKWLGRLDLASVVHIR